MRAGKKAIPKFSRRNGSGRAYISTRKGFAERRWPFSYPEKTSPKNRNVELTRDIVQERISWRLV